LIYWINFWIKKKFWNNKTRKKKIPFVEVGKVDKSGFIWKLFTLNNETWENFEGEQNIKRAKRKNFQCRNFRKSVKDNFWIFLIFYEIKSRLKSSRWYPQLQNFLGSKTHFSSISQFQFSWETQKYTSRMCRRSFKDLIRRKVN
jgi:hypothetical protein